MAYSKYPTSFKKKLIEEIKNGKSYRETANKHEVPLTTLKQWCVNEGIESKYRTGKTIRDKEIIETIKENKVVKTEELLKELNLKSPISLSARLKRLVREKKIKETILSGRTRKSEDLRTYMNRRVFFIENEDFKEWVLKKLPEKMPKNIKTLISRRFKEMGFDLEIPHKKEYKYVALTQKKYDEIKNKARNQGKSIKDYVEANLDD